MTKRLDGSKKGKLSPENFDDLGDLLASLDERARYWLSGEASWLFENYVNGKVGILIKFDAGGELQSIAKCSNRLNHTSIAQFDTFDVEELNCWGHQPVFIDVVRGYDAPQEVATRVRSICALVGVNVQDNTFEIGILPAEVVERSGTSAFTVFGVRDGLVETGFQSLLIFGERENSIVVGKADTSGKIGHQVVESRPQISDAVTYAKGQLKWNGGMEKILVKIVSEIHITAYSGCIVALNPIFPYKACCVRVQARPVKFEC